MEKGSFLIGLKYKKQIDGLTDESAGKLLKALMAHELGESCELHDGRTEMLYSIMADEQDENRKKYEEKCKSKQEAGAMGGLAKAAKAKSEKGSLANVASASCANKDIANLHDNDCDCDYEGDKEKEHKDFCPEPLQASVPESKSPPVISLILNDKSLYPVTAEQVKRWAELFPGVDIMQQLRNMAAWLESNPGRRKTKRGIQKFITGWLSREQDRSKGIFKPPTPVKPEIPQAPVPQELSPGKTWAEVYNDHPADIEPGMSWEDLV